jgi:hypothetical protein
MASIGRPAFDTFSPAERRVIGRLRTPSAVQRFLNALPYNTEPPPAPATLRSFSGVVRRHTVHCLEAALFAAVVLEQHGFPPLVMSLESIDELDHVIFIYQHAGRWGSVARSRDPGLHGRRPVLKTPRELARSYFEPYVDFTGCLKAFAVVDLRALGTYDWRRATGNVWKVERMLLDAPHRPLPWSPRRVDRLRAKYFKYRREHAGRKPVYYDRRTWTAIPAAFE